MRVLRVVGGLDPAFGGPSVSTVNSCVAAARAGLECTVVFPVDEVAHRWATRSTERLRSEGLTVITFPLARVFPGRARRWGVSPALIRWLVRNVRDYDVVHAHGAWTVSTVASLTLAKIVRRPIVLTPHESLVDYDLAKSGRLARSMKRLARRAYFRVVDLFVFASEIEARDTIGRGSARYAVLPHPVLDDRAEGPATRRTTGSGTAMRVGFLGRFDPKKNLELLLEAVAELPVGVRLDVAGSGTQESERRLRDRATALGLGERVTWLGFVDHDATSAFLDSLDVLAMPSAYECFGMAAAEALARGVPVVVSPTTGIADIVLRHGCGRVVPAEGRALAGALLDLVYNPAALASLSGRVATAAGELAFLHHGERLGAAYESVVAKSDQIRDLSHPAVGAGR